VSFFPDGLDFKTAATRGRLAVPETSPQFARGFFRPTARGSQMRSRKTDENLKPACQGAASRGFCPMDAVLRRPTSVWASYFGTCCPPPEDLDLPFKTPPGDRRRGAHPARPFRASTVCRRRMNQTPFFRRFSVAEIIVLVPADTRCIF